MVDHWNAHCLISAAVHEQETCQDTSKVAADQGDKPQQLASALRFDLDGSVVGLRPPDRDHDHPNAEASLRDPLRHAWVLYKLQRLPEESSVAWSEGVRNEA